MSHLGNTISFNDLGLNDAILKSIDEVGYQSPSPIQFKTIPHVLSGRDFIGQAQTGTGKTAAFALPTLQNIDSQQKITQVLVLTPTRELAIQVAEAYKVYARHLKRINILPIYGGADYKKQLTGLKRGAHIVIGTPGRVMDHIERGTLDLETLSTIVLDEADEMLRMGFVDDVEWILSKAPEDRQTILFSATMPAQIKKISNRYLVDEVTVQIAATTETATTVEQFFLAVKPKQKSQALLNMLAMEATDAAIIFVNTKAATEELAGMLNRNGYRAAALNGDLVQKQRERVIEQVQAGAIDIILATDVAARGIDIERISHVVNYDLPHDGESYVHRIGRTGRAGRSGRAILLVTPRDARAFSMLEKHIKFSITPYPMPTVEALNEHRIKRFKAQILQEVEHKDLDFLTALLNDLNKESDQNPLTLAAALASMMLGKKSLTVSKCDAIDVIDLKKMTKRREQTIRGDAAKSRRLPMRELDCFRLAVGRNDGVKPGHIVGAIINEANIEGSYIGPIEIFDDHTEVFLSKGVPKAVLQDLKKARVMGKALNLSATEPTARLSNKKNIRAYERPKRMRKTLAKKGQQSSLRTTKKITEQG